MSRGSHMKNSGADELAKKMKVKLDKDNFPEWYSEIVELSGLVDKRYPIKGMNVWLPYGWELMRNIDEVIRREMRKTSHKEVCFPLLIPQSEFQKEADHIKGFSDEVYWVTHGGSTPLDIPLLLRPTSETAMYPMFSLWVRSHSDLPLKIFQIVNVFRYETKQTRPFIRMREIHFFEAHTCHRDFEEAEKQIQEDLEIMDSVAKELCLPYLKLVRPEWDKFAGAFYSVGIDTLMPSGRTLQIASIHQYKDNFARAYRIMYEDESGEHRYAHQTTYGMSERLIGAVVGMHGDNRGIVLPPAVAPIQVIVVPIPKKGMKEVVEEEALKVKEELAGAGMRVEIDLRDLRPGTKFYDWELKGVPLRLEIGTRDIEEEVVTAVKRNTFEKRKIPIKELLKSVKELLDEVQSELYSAAENFLKEHIFTVRNLKDEAEAYRGIEGVIRVNWCGDMKCAEELEVSLDKSFLGFPPEEKPDGPCAVCGGKAAEVVYLSKSY